jgi:hypothetical protein
MARKNRRVRYNRKNLRNVIETRQDRPKTIKVNNKGYDTSKGMPNMPRIARATARLSKQGMSQPQNVVQSENQISEALLFSLGVSVETGYPHNQTSYSLLKNQTDTTLIDNENLFDGMQFKVITKPITLIDKFPNPANPIFQADKGLTSQQQKKRTKLVDQTKQPSVADVAAQMTNLNLSKAGSTIKQFTKNNRSKGTSDAVNAKSF